MQSKALAEERKKLAVEEKKRCEPLLEADKKCHDNEMKAWMAKQEAQSPVGVGSAADDEPAPPTTKEAWASGLMLGSSTLAPVLGGSPAAKLTSFRAAAAPKDGAPGATALGGNGAGGAPLR